MTWPFQQQKGTSRARVPSIVEVGDYWKQRSQYPRDRRQPQYGIILKEHRYASFGVPFIAKPHLKLRSAPERSAGDFGESAQLMHNGAEHPFTTEIREELELFKTFLEAK